MRLFLLLFSLISFFKGYSQTPITKSATTNVVQFDTIKIDKVSFTVYQNWKNVIAGTFELDSQYKQQYHPNEIYSRSNKGVLYSVKDKTEYYLAERYMSPSFFTEIAGKTDFLQFFKNAPKSGFNPNIINKDTVRIYIRYTRQQNKNDRTKSELYNRSYIASELAEFYKQNNIETMPKTTESANANQGKIKKLLDSCYLFVDSVVSNNSNHSIIGVFKTNLESKETSLTLHSVSRFKDFGPSEISIQYALDVSINKLLKMTIGERKKWFAYFLPIIKNIRNEQVNPLRNHQ